MECFKFYINLINSVSRNAFSFLPFVGPKKYKGKNRLNNKVVIVTGGNN